MTYIVTENCIKCKYTDCVDVCPVDCFKEGPNMLVIDPEECIDCTLCVAECPVDAIYSEDDLPDDQKEVLIYRYYNDLSFKEISEKTGVSINTSLGRMRYALINLRNIIKKKNIILTT